MFVPENDNPIEKKRMAAARHADIAFKRLWPRQPAQALPDLREAGLMPLSSLNLRIIGGKHRSAFFSSLFSGCSHNTNSRSNRYRCA
jgi:hypothetical protein